MDVSSARCRLDGMESGSVKIVSKNGKYRVPSMMANIFCSLDWGFVCVGECNVGLSFQIGKFQQLCYLF